MQNQFQYSAGGRMSNRFLVYSKLFHFFTYHHNLPLAIFPICLNLFEKVDIERQKNLVSKIVPSHESQFGPPDGSRGQKPEAFTPDNDYTMRTNLPKLLYLLIFCIYLLNSSLESFIMIFFVTNQLDISKFLPPQRRKT